MLGHLLLSHDMQQLPGTHLAQSCAQLQLAVQAEREEAEQLHSTAAAEQAAAELLEAEAAEQQARSTAKAQKKYRKQVLFLQCC